MATKGMGIRESNEEKKTKKFKSFQNLALCTLSDVKKFVEVPETPDVVALFLVSSLSLIHLKCYIFLNNVLTTTFIRTQFQDLS